MRRFMWENMEIYILIDRNIYMYMHKINPHYLPSLYPIVIRNTEVANTESLLLRKI